MGKKEKPSFHRLDHLANERTFLAWIRTNLGIMAFGFLIERFSFFALEKELDTTIQKYGSLVGITLVAIGAILCILVFFKFKKTENDIDKDTYRSTILLDTLLTLFLVVIGAVLIAYLIYSHI